MNYSKALGVTWLSVTHPRVILSGALLLALAVATGCLPTPPIDYPVAPPPPPVP